MSRGRGRQRGSHVSNNDGGRGSVQSQVLGEARCRAGLENHGLQEAETHHQVQGDGGFQEVPVQPQVPEPGHAVQVRGGEVLDGHQRGGADLRPVDFCREERKSRMEVRGKGRQRGMLGTPFPACLSVEPQNGDCFATEGENPQPLPQPQQEENLAFVQK